MLLFLRDLVLFYIYQHPTLEVKLLYFRHSYFSEVFQFHFQESSMYLIY